MPDLSSLDVFSEHAARAFAASRVVGDPFPHLVVRDVFPPQDYALLLAALPTGEEWMTVGKLRRLFNIDTDQANEATVRVWRGLNQTVMPRVIRPLLVAAFRQHLADYWAREGEDGAALEPFYQFEEGRLALRRPGYRLSPHLDPNRALLTVLVYLARPGDDATFGTELYRSQPPATYEGIYKADEHGLPYELAHTVPFTANTLLSFLTPVGLHGATFSADATYDRVTYQLLVALDDERRKEIKRRRRRAQKALECVADVQSSR